MNLSSPNDSPRWRGDDARRLPYRDAIRERLPGAQHGLVALDIDLLMRCYGSNYGTDRNGRFRFVEVKAAIGEPTGAQWHMFPMLDGMLRTADPARNRYMGFYVVTTPTEDWSAADAFHVMRIFDRARNVMTPAAFFEWLNFGRQP